MKPALTHEHPIAIAHRGSRTLWPENTMLAFQGAIDLGYRYLETDLHLTADGVLVCLHDDTLDRTTDGTGKVWQRHLADLQKLDAGFRFDSMHHFPHRGTGITIPTFEELVTAFPEAVITLDLKQRGLEAPVAAAIERFQLWDRVIVGSFSDRRLRRFRNLAGNRVATSAGPLETLRFVMSARTGRPAAIRADALQVPVRQGRVTVVDRVVVEAAHRLDKQVQVWTINDPDEMAELLDLGVDGLITDRPDLLRELMEDRGSGGPWFDPI